MCKVSFTLDGNGTFIVVSSELYISDWAQSANKCVMFARKKRVLGRLTLRFSRPIHRRYVSVLPMNSRHPV